MIENFDIFKDDKQNCYQLRTKTDSYVLDFDDDEKERIFLEIVDEIKENANITIKELKRKFRANANEPKVIDVLKTLDEYELLSFGLSKELKDGTESSKHSYSSEVRSTSNFILSILGQGELTKAIGNQAKQESFKSVNIYLYDEVIDIEKAVISSDFIVVDANQWSPYHVELLNKSAIKHNKPWLYVGGVDEFSMKIGPLFFGKETGCYNCLINRIKSNHEHASFLTSYEDHLRNNRKGSKPDIIPNINLVYNIISNLVLLEVMKFIEEWSLPATWRNVLQIDITNLNLTNHNLLKKPFCEVCKPQLTYNPAPWLEPITLL